MRPLARAQVEPRGLSGRRRLETVGGADHRPRELLDGRERVGGGPDCVEVRQRLASELSDLLLDPGGDGHAPAAQPPFQEVDVRAGEARVRRAQEGEQVAPLALEPGVAEQGDQRLAERRLAEAQATLERVGHSEGRERGVERSAPAVEGGADDRDLAPAAVPARSSASTSSATSSSVPREAGALEKSDRAVELGGGPPSSPKSPRSR